MANYILVGIALSAAPQLLQLLQTHLLTQGVRETVSILVLLLALKHGCFNLSKETRVNNPCNLILLCNLFSELHYSLFVKDCKVNSVGEIEWHA